MFTVRILFTCENKYNAVKIHIYQFFLMLKMEIISMISETEYWPFFMVLMENACLAWASEQSTFPITWAESQHSET